MKNSRRYKIDIFGLSNDTHQFQFEFDEAFFSEFENSLVSKGKGTCAIYLTKSDSMMNLRFTIEGAIELVCDRSLELFDFPISIDREVIYKFGDEEKELSEDVLVIPQNSQEINIGDFLYEFISIEVPMKKLHPRFDDEDDSDELIYSSKEENEEKKGTDPRWEALKKLK